MKKSGVAADLDDDRLIATARFSRIVTADPKQVLLGSWSAQALLDTPNAARGCWAIPNDANQIMLACARR